MSDIKHVPTNIVTGALGVGKTTLIQSLLQRKPAHERWAVLVNEFGEVGIDGALINVSSNKETEMGIFIKEVPGGCMCCASGLPMQIALNLLLAQARPDRLLIEPTGLGHPKEVLETLMGTHYQDVLDVHATLTLLDLRKLESEKWCKHLTFREQIQIADVIVLTKSDLYEKDYGGLFDDYRSYLGVTSTPVFTADKGMFDIQYLAGLSKFNHQHDKHDHAHGHHHHEHHAGPLTAPDEGVLKVVNHGEGYFSRGWLCSKRMCFDFDQCETVFSRIPVVRLKAVIHTNRGTFGFNLADGQLQVTPIDKADDSRIEFISDDCATADALAVEIEQALHLD